MSAESQEKAHDATRVASEATELMEVLWGRGRELATAPVSASQLKVLFILDDEDGVNLRTVTDRLGSTPPSVSRLCDRLEAVGFVHRTSSPSSRRELRVWLTESGRSFMRDLRARRERELHAVIARMPPRKRAMLLEGLAAFREAANRVDGDTAEAGHERLGFRTA
ncbi:MULTISPECIES: MarR family winged helix-turn-helix transcriptional regulator [unclassified Nocardiopsis]|uniref:MarR family winged helix-turn-helix transcriptional regulator n=1 Tax=unclassified Nocardiopsis TaxID=2649073 RepID=UPI000AD082F8|nr:MULTISPECIES: MarR family transcriptional regulator [unclassified Nocardiopsis]MBQ1084051.1 MarR family transcriptional regulator [Nocardiopsis sp. B62]